MILMYNYRRFNKLLSSCCVSVITGNSYIMKTCVQFLKMLPNVDICVFILEEIGTFIQYVIGKE